MVEELRMQVITVNAEDYWKAGGKLDRESIEKARSVLLALANGEIPKVNNNGLTQAEEYARLSQITITSEQKYLYVVLREMTRKTEESPTSPGTPGTSPPWSLGDQPLLAEVFLLTGDMPKRDSLKRAYPHIFQNDKVVEPPT